MGGVVRRVRTESPFNKIVTYTIMGKVSDEDDVLSHLKYIDVAHSTRLRYAQALQKIRSVCGKKLREVISDPHSVQKLKHGIPNLNTYHTTLTALLATIRSWPQLPARLKHAVNTVWYPELSRTAKTLRQHHHVMTPRQEQANVAWSTVRKKLNDLKNTEYASRDHLLLAMYALLPPRRQMDYARIHVVSSESTSSQRASIKSSADAYLDTTAEPYIIHVRKFKTCNSLKPWTKRLPSELCDIIFTSLRRNPRTYLFEASNGCPYPDANAFAQMSNRSLKRLFNGRPVTVNSLRHAYATHVHTALRKADIVRIAYDMGHSPRMNKAYVLLKKPHESAKTSQTLNQSS